MDMKVNGTERLHVLHGRPLQVSIHKYDGISVVLEKVSYESSLVHLESP